MNFVGKFDAKLPVEGPVAHPVALAHVDGASTHAPSDAIIVPDAQLLFGGEFKRSGVDLVLSKDDHELVLHDYFKGEKRVALASPDGAHLTGDLVNALAGHVEYAQADGAVAAAVVVGHVTKLTGTATAIRNGVSIILNQGDNIDKGDVLQSGADSTLGVTFIDGTVFGLSSNARMVVNEMIYDPNGSNNSSLLSLVAGTISFVAGETAKHGDMKVDTPVATMGIRGTAVLVEIDFSVPGQNGAPSANFQVLVEPDGTTGSYILFDKNTLAPLATVNTAGTLTKISQGVVSFQAGTALTPDEQKLISDLFTTKFGDNNTKTIDHAFTDTPIPQSLAPIKLADGTTATPIVLIVTNPGGSSSSGSGGGTSSILHIPGPPTVVTFNDTFTELAQVTGSTALDTQTGQIRFADINAGDLPTVKVEFSSFIYQDAHHGDITHALSPTEQAAIKAVEGISLQPDAGNNNNGTATWTYSFPDGAFDFLGAGETLTLTYTASVNNNFLQSPEIGIKQFTITITGTNDVPVITSSIPQTITFVGGTSVPGGDLTAHVPTSGTIAFDDPDLTDTHTVSVKLLLDGLDLPPTPLQIFEQALTASIATDSTGTGFGTVNWKLADLPVYLADFIPKGETVTLTYAVTVTDSQGATSTQDITVTITGTDTPAVVWIATTKTGSAPGGLWSDASNWETGNVPTANDDAIIITDQLIGLTPSYPVTIDATTAAVAKSLTMNDFGTSPPELINLGMLAVSGAFNMSADSVLHNSGIITVGGSMEVLGTSVVLNSGGIAIEGGADFGGQSTVTNTGTGVIEISGGAFTMSANSSLDNSGIVSVGGSMELLDESVLLNDHGIVLRVGGDFSGQSSITNTGTGLIEISGGALNVGVGIANAGQVAIDSAAALKLSGAAIDGGVVINRGTFDLSDNAILKNGTLYNTSEVNISGAAIDGDTVINQGALDLTGNAVLKNGTVDNTSQLNVSGAGNAFVNETINNGVTSQFPALFYDLSVASVNAAFEADAGAAGDILFVGGNPSYDINVTGTLALNGATINGGAVSNSGTIDVTGDSTITGASVTGGLITVEADTTLTLDGTSLTGELIEIIPMGITEIPISFTEPPGVAVDPAGVFVSGSTITNDGTIKVDAGNGIWLSNTAITGGTIANFGSVEIVGSSNINNDTLNNNQLTVDTSQTLTLDGSTVTGGTVGNYGTVAVDTDQTLTLQGGVAVHGGTLDNSGTVHIEGSSGATLDGVTVSGGGDIEIDCGEDTTTTPLVLEGGTAITDGTLTVGSVGVLDVETTAGATLDDVGVTNDNSIEVFGGSALTLDDGTSVSNNDGTITVDETGTLTLDDASISGGTLDNSGTVHVEGSSGATLDGVTVTGGSDIQIDCGEDTTTTPLVLEGGTTVTDGTLTVGTVGLLDIKTAAGATLDDVGVTNENSIEVFGGSALTLDDGTSVSNADGTITVDETGTLTLDDATISGGTLDNSGMVQIEGSAGATLDGVTVTGGGDIQIDFDADTTTTPLVLEGGTTVTDGTLTVGTVGVLDIETAAGATLDDVGVTNQNSIEVFGGSALTLDDGTSVSNADGTITVDETGTLTLDDATISGGTLDNSGTVHIEGSAGATLDGVTVTGGGDIQIDCGEDTTTTPLVLEGGTAITDGTLTVGSVGVLDVETADGATLDDVGVTNDNSIEVFGGSALTLDDGTSVNNTDGIITVDESGTLTLDDASISGGTLDNSGTIDIEGSSGATLDGVAVTGSGDIEVDGAQDTVTTPLVLEGGTTITDGTLTVGSVGVLDVETADGATLDDVGVTNDNSIEVFAGSTLTLDGGTSVTNADGAITIDGAGTLTLNDATIVGGTLGNSGTMDIEGSSGATLDGVAVTGAGTIQVDGSDSPATTPLVLDDGTTITDGKLQVGLAGVLAIKTAKGATLNDVAVTNDNSIEVFAAGALVLGSGTIVDNTSGVVTVDGSGALTLSQATIDGGTINDFSMASGGIAAGDIDITSSSTISNADLNNGQVTIEANQTLTLDGTTVTGTTFAATAGGAVIQIDGHTTLTLDHATINSGTINDYSTASGDIVAGDIDVTGSSTIGNAHLNNGQVTIEANQTLTLDNDTITGTHFADAADGAVIQIDGGTRLKLDHASIDGGIVDDFSTASDGIVAGDIDVIGSSTISNAQINHGDVTIESGQTLILDGDTVIGTAFTALATDSVIQVDGGDTLTLNGATVSGGGVTIGTDALVKTSGDVTLTNTGVTNDGTIEITGGTLTITGSIASSGPDTSGSIKIDSGAVLDLDGSDTQNVVFAGTNGELQIDTSSFGGTISGLAATDEIDLSTIGYGPGTTGTYSGGVLTITDGTHSISMTLTGDYSDAHFAGVSDGHGGTLITLNADDDAPAVASADKVQPAAVTELADTTGSTASDSSSPASGTIHFTDIDLTDRPTATITQSVTWTNGTADLSLSLTPTETSALEQAFSLTQPENTNNGALDWSYQISDDALDFLGAGETATVTSTVLLDDHQGGHDTATVTVTVTGANDAPVLAADTSGTAGTGLHAITELAGQTGDTTDVDSATGTLSFTDADLTDTHTVSQGTPTYLWSGGSLTTAQTNVLTAAATLILTETDSTHSGAGSVGFTYGAPDNTFDFLAAGETLTVTYGVTVTDSHGISSTQPVTMTITGSNDAPALAVDHSGANGLHAITEIAGKTGDTTGVDSASGTLSFTDADLTDTHTIGQGTPTYVWSGGSLTETQTDALTAAATLALTETDSTHTGTGSVGFTYSAADSSFDFLAVGETLKVTYDVTVTDNHDLSSTQPVTITINGANDAPVLAVDSSGANGTALHAITELAGQTGDTTDVDSATGTLSFTDVDLDDTHTVSQGTPIYLWSGGSLTTAQTNALTAAATLALTEADSTHTGTGSVGFTYSAADCSFDFLAAGETLTVAYDVTVTDNHNGSSTQPVTITITGTNDAPVLAADSSGADGLHAITELAGKTGDTTDVDSSTGTLSFTDADLTDTHTVSQGAPVYVWSGGSLTTTQTDALTAAATLALTETDSTHTGTGSVGFTYSAADSSFDFLAVGETLKVTYDVTVTDSHDISSTQPVTITINGANDAPVLAVDHSGANGTALHAITELAGQTGDTTDVDSATGTLSFTDADLTDTHTVSQGAPTYVWSGGTLTGTQADALTAAATLTLTETDNAGSGAIGFTYGAADSNFDFLAAGETLKVTYNVTVTDNHGGSSTQPVTITITGTNDAPVLAADHSGANGTALHTISELAGKTGDSADVDSASGTLSFTDADLDDTHTLGHSGPTYVLSGGTLDTTQAEALTAAAVLALTESDSTHTGIGSVGFSYSAPDSSFDFLAEGQTLTVSYSITVTDNSCVSSSQPVTFTVTGSNDAPAIVGETDPAAQTIILEKSPAILSAGLSTNALGLNTETFDGFASGSSSNNGFGYGNFTSEALDATFTASGDAGIVQGSSSVTAAPFIGSLPGHADTTNYLSIGGGGSETITFAAEQNQFGLYWGSVDSFNTINFFDGSHLVASYSGVDVARLAADGNRGSFSSDGYVEFSDLVPFDKVVLASSSGSFEIDNISAGYVADSHANLAAPITGTLTVSDADIGDTLTASVMGNAVVDYNGSTAMPSDVNVSALIDSGAITFSTVKTTGGQDVLDWTYNAAKANLDFLEPGDKLTLTFDVQVSDGHAATGEQALTVTLVGNGSSIVDGTAQNDTFANVGGGVTIFGDGGHDTYNFNPHFGNATIGDFDASNDVIDISSTSFASTSALLGSAVESGVNTVITDSAGDRITLDHVSVAQLDAHPNDFQFDIANGGLFEVSASTSENVIFDGSAGKLKVDTPSSFAGTISGFTGDGTLSGSDQIDLKGIDYHSSAFAESFNATDDTLALSDGIHSALLHFNGVYQAANFRFATDNNGGTIVYDPPVTGNSNATPQAVTATSHGFVFNFTDNAHDLAPRPPGDTHLFDGQTFVNAVADSNEPHADSHGNVAPDSLDAPAIAALRAHLHVHDFHFV